MALSKHQSLSTGGSCRRGLGGDAPRRGGFTLVELLVVVSIIAMLVTILMPMLSKAKEMARKTVCLTNHHAMTRILNIYLADNNQVFPYSTNSPDVGLDDYRWVDLIDDNGSEEMRICTGGANWASLPYTDPQWVSVLDPEWNSNKPITKWIAPNPRMMPRNDKWQQNDQVRADTWKRPHQLFTQVDHKDETQAGGWVPSERMRFRHDGGMSINLGFLDGHAANWDRDTADGESPYNLLHNNSAAGFYYPWGEAREDPPPGIWWAK